MEKILISACLMGRNCKYNGGNNGLSPEIVEKLREKYQLIEVCPECDGGLSTPRLPSERRGEKLINSAGEDVTGQFKKGAELALKTAIENGCRKALFKERSPSCGSGVIYDGSFSKSLKAGDGVTAELLKKNGIEIIGESKINLLI